MTGAYYNEIDNYAAAWLRNLIAAGHIAPGDVDERSIADVRADDLAGYVQCHFFAGIGGWSYALRLAGWPDDRPVWTGSCPCQPWSAAGKRGGADDPRHLWPEWFRLIRECRPTTVFGEQVASRDGLGWFDLVSADMEGTGYAVGAADLCAASVGAPHIRQRLWFVAHPEVAERWGAGDETDSGWRTSETGGPSGTCIVGNAGIPGLAGRPREPGDDGAQREAVERTGDDACGVADADGGFPGDGRVQRGGGHLQREEDAAASFWSECTYLPCRDGKWRPAPVSESGIFPVAHGTTPDMGSDRPGEASPFRVIRDPKTGKSRGQAPWRVGMLRGYGNAIVPEVAAEFVRAAMEASP